MKEKFLIYLKGIGMGAADVVPGVSGGTIAFITGIYENLLDAIRSVDLQALQLLLKFDLKGLWTKVNGPFLLPLMAGIFTAIFTLAKLMRFLLSDYPIMIWSFFFGLIIASALLVSKQVKQWGVQSIIALLIGTVISYYITIAAPAEAPEGLGYIFLAGAIAICAMILPGISGSFILLLLGQYNRVLTAVSNLDITKIATFGAGCVVGILAFSRVLHFLLKRYHDATVALLTGFMLGSLNKVWPWKETVSTYTDRHGVVKPLIEENILPQYYEGENHLVLAICLAFAGFFMVYGIEKIAEKFNTPKREAVHTEG
ncbi:DUF368 domain-containing protein [Algivirga pacifica]|uniref:DUF368 domain-containing protein n=1 Tax=Algivirga pacifica TaxID=1162670 RepID=A0ABP9DS55_9BACT